MGRFICNLPFEDNKIREIYTPDIYKRVIAAFELGELVKVQSAGKFVNFFGEIYWAVGRESYLAGLLF